MEGQLLKRLTNVLLIFILFLSIMPLKVASASQLPFTDLSSSSRAYKEVKYLYDKNYMVGHSSKQYAPGNMVSRGQAVAVVGRALNIPEKSHATKYKDIGPNYRFSNFIHVLSERGMLTMIKGDRFEPDRPMTRGEVALLLNHAFGKSSSDLNVAIQYMMDEGISEGKANGDFGANDKVQRVDFAVLVARAINPAFRVAYTETYYVNTAEGNGLNVRNKPTTTNSVVLGKLSRGDKLSTTKPTNGWVRFSYQGQTAYTSASYLSKEPPTQVKPTPVPPTTKPPTTTPPVNGVAKYVYVPRDASAANVRAKANGSSAVVFTVPSREKVYQLSTSGTWVYIEYNGKRGYISNSLILNEKPYTPPKATQLNKEIIILDAGHGGKDPGALGNGYTEAQATLAISKYAKKYFDASPFQLKMTRTEPNQFYELYERVDFAHREKGSLFVSVHINSFSNPSANGIETYYHSSKPKSETEKESKAMASYLQDRAIEAWAKVGNRGVKSQGFYVIRMTAMPSTLLEAGFISNPENLKKISSPEWQEKMGRAVYLGVLDYYYHEAGLKSQVLPLYEKIGEKPPTTKK